MSDVGCDDPIGICDAISDGVNALADTANNMKDDVESSGFVKRGPKGNKCKLNKELISGWDKFSNDDLFGMVDKCMNKCQNAEGTGNCSIVYAGHSMGGASAMATALKKKKSYNAKNTKSVSIYTFGQPPTFGTECSSLNEFEDTTYRFVQLKIFDGGEKATQDIVPAIDSGLHFGNAVFISDRMSVVKLYNASDPNVDIPYGNVPGSFDYTNKRHENMFKAHDISAYKDRIEDWSLICLEMDKPEIDPSLPPPPPSGCATAGILNGGFVNGQDCVVQNVDDGSKIDTLCAGSNSYCDSRPAKHYCRSSEDAPHTNTAGIVHPDQ